MINRLHNALHDIALPRIRISETVKQVTVVISRTHWRGDIATRVTTHIRNILGVSLAGWGFSLGAGILNGIFTGTEVLWILLGAVGWIGTALVGYSLWFLVAVGGIETISLKFPGQHLSLRRYYIFPWCRIPYLHDQTVPIHRCFIEMRAPHKEFGLVAVTGNALCLLLDGKRCELARDWSLSDRERLYTLFRKYLAPQYDYALITRVMLGDAEYDRTVKAKSSYTTISNPDVVNLDHPMRSLAQIDLYPRYCDMRYVEQFITYAVNYVGQKTLKKRVVVVVYGCRSDLHPHLHNAFMNLCKDVRYMYGDS